MLSQRSSLATNGDEYAGVAPRATVPRSYARAGHERRQAQARPATLVPGVVAAAAVAVAVAAAAPATAAASAVLARGLVPRVLVHVPPAPRPLTGIRSVDRYRYRGIGIGPGSVLCAVLWSRDVCARSKASDIVAPGQCASLGPRVYVN